MQPMNGENDFSLAPAAIVRVASWPLEDLVALGDPSLAQRAAQVDPGQAEAMGALEADYEASVEAGRAHLWATTVADPRFRAALVLSSPGVHRQIGVGRRSRRRNKSARHLDTSLFRYLSRACTRTEPFGLWTGVTLAQLGEGDATRFECCAARARLAPELAVWRDLIRELARREPYRNRGPWCLNPTLRADAEGHWSYARRRARDGALRWQALPAAIGVGLRGALDGRGGSLEQLREHLCAELGEAGGALIELAVEQGLLVGGMAFPTRYADPWEALEQAEAALEREHATLWANARRRAHALCEALTVPLEAALAEQPAADESETALFSAAKLADAVLDVDRALGALVAELAAGLRIELGIELPIESRTWLRCDLGAPWTIELGRADRDRLERILVDWSGLERRHHVAARRRAGAAARLRACPEGVVMAAPSEDGSSLAANEPPDPAPDSEAGPPLGALVLRAGVDGLARPWLRGLSNVPTATHARHAYHLAELGDPLLPWFCDQYRELAREGVEVVDLAYEHEASPNLVSRPCYVPTVIAPWSGAASETLSQGALLGSGPQPGGLLVYADGRAMSLHAFTATATPSEDPILERLLATSFDNRADQIRTLAEGPRAAEDPHEPSTSTAILEPRRLSLSADEVRSLSSVHRFERYRRWQRLAAALELPELVRLYTGARPGLVIPTSSPLALEAALEGLRSDDVIVIEEVLERGWLPGSRGTHVAELVMPLRRRDHLWRAQEKELEHAMG
jgi:hypothetical protein